MNMRKRPEHGYAMERGGELRATSCPGTGQVKVPYVTTWCGTAATAQKACRASRLADRQQGPHSVPLPRNMFCRVSRQDSATCQGEGGEGAATERAPRMTAVATRSRSNYCPQERLLLPFFSMRDILEILQFLLQGLKVRKLS